MVSNLNDLKKQIFYDLLELAGRVFIVVRHSDRVRIGSRGFLPEEKEKGIVLVFNKMMHFEWGDAGISATLGFGSRTEKCFIPPDDIFAVFSPELSAQFTVSREEQDLPQAVDSKTPAERHQPDQKVVKVDFNKKK
ncbi:MAG: hypothetical protein EPN25_09755 [Nitrospirae bacterium]|nr:MAG: hypothetical protein EPN25_09755 [Nitrospirota bacterium]